MGIERHAEAIPEWLAALNLAPENSSYMAHLALCQSEVGDRVSSLANAQRAIALGPDKYYPIYVYALLLLRSDQPKQAEKVAREGLQSNPESDDLHAVLAGSLADQKRWKPALQAAYKALELDPENRYALLIRTHCLSVLGDKGAIQASFENLAIHTEEPSAHTAHGYALLRGGKTREAAEAFGHALRLDPLDDGAREGLKTAVRSLFPPYRWQLSYQFFCQRYTKSYWPIFILLTMLRAVFTETAKQGSIWLKVIGTSMLVVVIFLLYGWIFVVPLSNLIIRFHPVAKYMLSRSELIQANYFGGFASVAALCGLGALFNSNLGLPAVSALIGLGMIGVCTLFTSSEKTRIVFSHLIGVGCGVLTLGVLVLALVHK